MKYGVQRSFLVGVSLLLSFVSHSLNFEAFTSLASGSAVVPPYSTGGTRTYTRISRVYDRVWLRQPKYDIF